MEVDQAFWIAEARHAMKTTMDRYPKLLKDITEGKGLGYAWLSGFLFGTLKMALSDIEKFVELNPEFTDWKR